MLIEVDITASEAIEVLQDSFLSEEQIEKIKKILNENENIKTERMSAEDSLKYEIFEKYYKSKSVSELENFFLGKASL